MDYIDVYNWTPSERTIPVVCRHLAAMMANGGLIRSVVVATTLDLCGGIAARNLAAAFHPDTD